MTPFLSLLSGAPYIELPKDWVGWLGLLLMAGILVMLQRSLREYNRLGTRRQQGILIALVIFAPLAALFVGIRLEAGNALPPPGIPLDTSGKAVMLFASLPAALAAGLLGPAAAAGIALLSGLVRAAFDSHTLFTSFELAVLMTVFSMAVQQRYRTKAFNLLRHPIAIGFGLALTYPLLNLLVTPLTVSGIPVIRVDYTVSNLMRSATGMAIELILAALFAEVIARIAPEEWGPRGPLVPSPAEKSLKTRFVSSMLPLLVCLILTLMLGDWIVAGKAAKKMLEARMANAAEVAAENVPYFLETGQSLIMQLASDARMLPLDGTTLVFRLEQDIRTVPFFNQLAVLNANGEIIASYPNSDFMGPQAPDEERLSVERVLAGIPFQTLSIPPKPGQPTAQVAFVAALLREDGSVAGALVGHSDLNTNPFTQPILSSLNNLTGDEGLGMLLDESNRILVHPNPELLMSGYTGEISNEPRFYESAAPDGTRTLVYFQPARGRPWSVVLTVPASRAQQLALDIALPLLAMILILGSAIVILLLFGLRVVTTSLQNLSTEAGRLAEGKLDNALTITGEDEVGHLRRAFEQMRRSLKARLDELNRLLMVSQGVASSLDMAEAVQPILESSLAMGASAARVVLAPAVVPEIEGDPQAPISFGLGVERDLYNDLDEQILNLTRQKERLVLPNLSRPRLLHFAPGEKRPESLMAVALRHENQYYGALWVAYEQPQNFTEGEVRFLVTLGGQAALAAANAHLFMSAEIGRQRLAAILASSPDPVLVIDQRERMLLANPAAWQVLGISLDMGEGLPVEQVIQHEELRELLRSSSAEKQSKEINLPDRRVYLATATPVMAEGRRVGRVCVLRDVTHFKELDALKSDFVSTVSHDLRSPLTLMRGYATMLEMVGQLNEQQINYVSKIVSGVESMSRLVNNLLDLGRIEAGIGLQLEMIQIFDVVERVVGALQLQAAQKRIQLTADIPQETVPLVEADQALIQQALHNLVENAIKYTRPDGKIQVRVQVRPVGMVFAVSDTGIGISPMDLPRLFEKFYRGAQQAAKEQRGTGLGLAIVKSIADRHGGRVWAESQLGKGSTFYLAIPIRQGQHDKNIYAG